MIFIGICGPSNSGKSSLCKELAKKYDAGWIEMDHYLKNINLIPTVGKYKNWELPENYRPKKVFKDLEKLNSGKSINHPIYSFKKGKIKGYRKVEPKKIIFVEGFYLFSDKKIRELLGIKIYLDIPIEEVLKRRVCTEEEWSWSKRDYLEKIYVPMYETYGFLQKKFADFVIDATLPQKIIQKKVDKIIKPNL